MGRSRGSHPHREGPLMTRVLLATGLLVALAFNATSSEAVALLAVAAAVTFVVGVMFVLGDALQGGGR